MDYLDPGAAYYQFSYMILLATQDTLLGWKPQDVAAPSPLLATKPPDVSRDGKTVTIRIHAGIHYSPPLGGGQGVDRPVEADDVKYALERGLLPGVANAYERIYLDHLVGFRTAVAEAATSPNRAPDISGIHAPHNRTLVLDFTKPVTPAQLQTLSLPITAPVPREYAAPFDAQSPSTYGENQLSTGPYYISRYEAGKEITLDRNPNWDPSTDFRPAYVDRIQVEEGFTDSELASRKILEGSGAVNGDFAAGPPILKLAAETYPHQLALTPTGGTQYVVLNTAKPPFDDLNVRRAVVAASDRVALRKTRGGALAGPIAQHFLPPGMPGSQEAGGLRPPPGLDFMNHPHGNLALAQEYMRRAGYTTGRCTGSQCSVTMIADNAPIDVDAAQLVREDLSRLGFKVDLNTVDRDVMYSKFCNVPANEPNVCPSLGWLKDFSDPQSALNVAFDGRHLNPWNNYDWPLLDVPRVNRGLEHAALLANPSRRAAAYARLDREITAQAPAIPWVWLNEGNIESADVNGVINRFNANWDLASTSLRH